MAGFSQADLDAAGAAGRRLGERIASAIERSRPLCPDHRDKQAGKECLACEIERLKARLYCVVRNAVRLEIKSLVDAYESGEPGPLSGPVWHRVAELTGLGSTRAIELCRDAGVDPHHENAMT